MTKRKVEVEDWELFLERIKTAPIYKVIALPDMPSAARLYKKQLSDPAFNARITLVTGRAPGVSKKGRCGRKVTGDRWDKFFAGIGTASSIRKLCARPGMPSQRVVERRRKDDPEFAAKLDEERQRARVLGAYETQIPEASWEAMLVAVRHQPLRSLRGKDGTPSEKAVSRRCKLDPVFAARFLEAKSAREVVAHSQTTRFKTEVSRRENRKARIEKRKTLRQLALQKRMTRSQKKTDRLLLTARNRRAKIETKAERQRMKVLRSKPIGETFKRQLAGNELYSAVIAVVPKGLPPATRDDIVSDMVLAVLEGNLDVADLKKRAQEFVGRHSKMFETFKTTSLDAPRLDGSDTVGERFTYEDGAI